MAIRQLKMKILSIFQKKKSEKSQKKCAVLGETFLKECKGGFELFCGPEIPTGKKKLPSWCFCSFFVHFLSFCEILRSVLSTLEVTFPLFAWFFAQYRAHFAELWTFPVVLRPEEQWMQVARGWGTPTPNIVKKSVLFKTYPILPQCQGWKRTRI